MGRVKLSYAIPYCLNGEPRPMRINMLDKTPEFKEEVQEIGRKRGPTVGPSSVATTRGVHGYRIYPEPIGTYPLGSEHGKGREVKGRRAPFPSTKPYQTCPLTASFGATKAPALVPLRSRGHGGGPGPSRRSHNPNPYYRAAAQVS
ncbi:hypothetical protein CRG98_006574 [Punica granatum]|uniref:Uncharacterized protein n=1 Tax=Punica granatum TaxID=22663 RepID=A0A2I0KXD9_PUNGR|nr:hypothetical protein CRG98_006574 [Punica granatum]